jgi:uncharacterized DUF497 family protein
VTKKKLPFKVIEFIWDDGNKLKNWLKHEVESDECEQVFFQNKGMTYFDEKHSTMEQRWLILGVTDKGRKFCSRYEQKGENNV